MSEKKNNTECSDEEKAEDITGERDESVRGREGPFSGNTGGEAGINKAG